MYRLLHISDQHLSERRAYGVANFGAVCDTVAATSPDLVVSTGDLVLDAVDDDDDHRFARECFDRIEAPWRVLPGNHDIGDGGTDPWMGEEVTAPRRARFVGRWGQDWWVEEAEAWVVVGLDSLLLGSDLDAEETQRRFLEAVLSQAGARPIMLMLHKPLCLADPDEPGASQMAITPLGRRRLREMVGGARVGLVASGHVHEYRSWMAEGITMVWAPSTAFIARRGEPSRFGGAKLVGAVEYRFAGRGVTWTVVRPPGMVDNDSHALSGGTFHMRSAPERPATADAPAGGV